MLPGPDGHESKYSWQFISNYLHHDYQELDDPRSVRLLKYVRQDADGPLRPVFFGRQTAEDPPSVHYDRVMLSDDSGVAELTDKIVGQPGAVLESQILTAA